MTEATASTSVRRPPASVAAAAVEAWCSLGMPPPREVHDARDRKGASQVLRLSGLGSLGDVYAKCAGIEANRREALVLSEILSDSEVPALACFGHVPAGPGRSWLFLQSATGRPLDGGVRSRAALALVAAQVHNVPLERTTGLPRRPRRPFVRQGEALLASAAVRSVEVQAAAMALHRLQEVLIARRHLLELFDEMHDVLDARLIHGDLAPKNARLAGDGKVWLFDWETATVGPPVVDLAGLHEETYLRALPAAARWWSQVAWNDVVRLGRLARLLDSMSWSVDGLHPDWPGRSLRRLNDYTEELERWGGT